MHQGIRIFLLAVISGLLCGTAGAQSLWRVDFRDKANHPLSLERPEEFLSERALQRRAAQNIPLDESDLPVHPAYVDTLTSLGAIPVNASRWMNSLTVYLPADSLATTIASQGFVAAVECTRPATPAAKSARNKFGIPGEPLPIDTSRYGASVYQVGQLNGQALHTRGYTGKGVMVAILDAGFYMVNTLPAFDSLRLGGRIAGSRDMVWPPSDVYQEHTHGMMVLSTMGGLKPGALIGTAPHASYWLIRTEDTRSEFPVEEDNWIAGAELADSAGCDIINSSLGYSTYDLPELSHSFADLDGRTTRAARGANMAAAKGLLVFSSAGNEGNKAWKKIQTPADGDSVIAVAAVDRYGVKTSFSSVGPSADAEVKPTLAAMGQNNALEGINGQLTYASGTSFSSPVLAGMAACLWQARPDAPAYLIKEALIRSAHQFLSPDSLLGFGIPDMQTALDLLITSISAPAAPGKKWSLYPIPFRDALTFFHSGEDPGETHIELFSITGQRLFHTLLHDRGPHRIAGLGHIPAGPHVVRISGKQGTETHLITGGMP